MQRRLMIVAMASAAACVGAATYVVSRGAEGAPVVVAASSTTVPTAPTSTSTTTTTPTTASVSPAAPSTTAAPSSVASGPPFESNVSAVTVAQLGASWHEGCPVPAEQLRAVDLSYWGYDGTAHQGRLVVQEAHADAIVAVFRDIYAARFPIERMTPIDAYGGDDQASMRANNTSGFNCRTVSGSSSWSEHAFGRAIDVNPFVNPYVKASGAVDPPEAAAYADRRRTDTGMIHGGDAVVRAFAAQGWRWGGYWSKGKDYQHFSATGR